MSFRARIAIAAATAVALAVVLASVLVFFVVRDQLRGQIDQTLEERAAKIAPHPLGEVKSAEGESFLSLRPGFGEPNTLLDAVRAYADHHGALAKVLAESILVQIFRVIQAWCLGQALGLTLPLATYFAFIPLIVFIMQIPITPNGIGTTQFAFDRFLVPQGAPAPQVFALSVLFLGLGVLGSLPGGLLYAMGRGDGGRGTRPRTTRT